METCKLTYTGNVSLSIGGELLAGGTENLRGQRRFHEIVVYRLDKRFDEAGRYVVIITDSTYWPLEQSRSTVTVLPKGSDLARVAKVLAEYNPGPNTQVIDRYQEVVAAVLTELETS